jgi:hypothetical protein
MAAEMFRRSKSVRQGAGLVLKGNQMEILAHRENNGADAL